MISGFFRSVLRRGGKDPASVTTEPVQVNWRVPIASAGKPEGSSHQDGELLESSWRPERPKTQLTPGGVNGGDLLKEIDDLGLYPITVPKQGGRDGVIVPDGLATEFIILNDGRVLLTQAVIDRQDVQSVVQMARDYNHVVQPNQQWHLVGSDLISQLYGRVGGGRQKTPNEKVVSSIVDLGSSVWASDIFLKYNDREGQVKFRIDSDVSPVLLTFPRSEMAEIIASAYGMMDQVHGGHDELKHQSGRIRDRSQDYALPASVSALRCAFNRLAEGRELAMRVHYRATEYARDFGSLGFAPAQKSMLNSLVLESEGLIGLSGKTGSGKSTLLKIFIEQWYAVRHGRKRVVTVEDPVEFEIPCAEQFTVNVEGEDREGAFHEVVKQALRSNPDLLGCQELRDRPTADAALQFVLSGHGGLSTWHAVSVDMMFLRLQQMGLDTGEIFDTPALTGLVHMGLMPKLCPHCKEPLRDRLKDRKILDLAERIARIYGDWGDLSQIHIASEKGCDLCRPSPRVLELLKDSKGRGSDFAWGIKGRTVVAEMVRPVDQYRRLLKDGRCSEARIMWIKELGGTTKLDHALALMFQGHISPIDIELGLAPFVSRQLTDGNNYGRHPDGRDLGLSAGPEAFKRLGLSLAPEAANDPGRIDPRLFGRVKGA